jgi:hypothetical protein
MSKRSAQHWSSEEFLLDACDVMVAELDWDTVDSGRLHRASCASRTLDGAPVIVAVLDNIAVLPYVLEDAGVERRDTGVVSAPLWLYLPEDLDVQMPADSTIRIRRVASRTHARGDM